MTTSDLARAAAPPLDPYNRTLAIAMSGVLAEFNRAEVLSAADVHVARQLGVLGGESNPDVLLAVALAVRAVRNGSVCLDLATVQDAVVGDAAEAILPAAVPDPELARQLAAVGALSWPEPGRWAQSCRDSPLVTVMQPAPTVEAEQAGGPARPLRWSDGLLYLDRYWRQERLVADGLDARGGDGWAPADWDLDRLRAAITRMFPAEDEARQRIASASCAVRRLAVIAGGPGTGKTTAVARMLAVLVDQDGRRPRIALAAPTGKAAARLQQAVRDEVATLDAGDRQRLGELTASTLHRLLGWKPRSKSRFRHDRTNRLPYDIVVVDETSMVSLTMMARLMEAVRPDARLVLVGDPDQLASVEAGAVLGDVVARATGSSAADRPGPGMPPPSAATGGDRSDGLRQVQALCPRDLAGIDTRSRSEIAAGVTRLSHRFRFDGIIADLADAVRTGDADAALSVLTAGHPDVSFLPWHARRDHPELAPFRTEMVAAARALTGAAVAGDVPAALAAMDRHRLLCAHRRGPFGAALWGMLVQRWTTEDLAKNPLPGNDSGDAGWWQPGRPLLVGENDYELGLFNGDTGVVVRHPERGIVAAFGDPHDPILVRPGRLSGVQSVHAMTIHKSQGSQFRSVTVILPPAQSPLLTRELLYTAATRASDHVGLIGTEDAVRAAVNRPVTRASGLRRRQPAAM